MMKNFCFIVILTIEILGIYAGQKEKRTWQEQSKFNIPRYHYDKLYRNKVYTNMSSAAREVFFAVNVHPSCKQKTGQCIPRGKCINKKMFYISRGCYARGMVCCYDDTIRNPTVGVLRTNENSEELNTTMQPNTFTEDSEAVEFTHLKVEASNATANTTMNPIEGYTGSPELILTTVGAHAHNGSSDAITSTIATTEPTVTVTTEK